MLMFDPQYVRPDDVGTQRNKSLILTQTDTLQAVEAVTPRSGDKAEMNVVSAVTDEKRKQHSRDRRQQDRRQQTLSCLLDTRSNRERRCQLRRQQDMLLLEPELSSSSPRLGINEVT